jgi:hypothetical protein
MPEILFDATKPAAPVEGGTRTVVDGVSSTARDRVAADLAAAKAAGFSPAPALYTEGTLVNTTGHGNYNASRQDVDALPKARTALRGLEQRIKSEGRADRTLAARALSLGNDGTLSRGGPRLALTERALKSLCSFVTPGGAAYLSACPPDLRATNVNHWLQAQEAERELTVRLRKGGAGPECFAVVGPRYAAFDGDRVAAEVAAALPDDARADVTYDGYKMRANILWHSNVDTSDVAAGEIFKAGILVRSSDDGSGSIKVDSMVWRNLCLNLIIVDRAEQSHMRRRHVGSQSSIGDAIRTGMAEAMQAMRHFRTQWGYARTVDVAEKFNARPQDVFGSWIDDELVAAPGGRALVLDRLMTAWRKEPGERATDYVNAVTRAAHEATWASPWVADDLQQQAGKLLASVDRWVIRPEKQ